jgi:SH3-like domain-containing protein
MNIIALILSLLISLNLYADKGPVTSLEIPRFVSLKSNDVNLRVGPSINYPIKLKYIQKNYPIEIIDEFDVWRKARDHEGNIGWLHRSLIKGDRFVLSGIKIKRDINLHKRPNGKITGLIKKNNILDLNSCILNWCKVSQNNISGWLLKKNIWGVYETEIYNIKFYQPFINQYWKILNSELLN